LAQSNTVIESLGIKTTKEIYHNLASAILVEHAVLNRECSLSQSGAVIVETGLHTGRSPKDKFIVDYGTPYDAEIAWGSINKTISPENFERLYAKVIHHLEKSSLYIQDVKVGNHPVFTRSIRIITEKAWAALFARDLLIPSIIENGKNPDFTLLHAPTCQADPKMDGTTSGTFIILNFAKRIILIGGTSYAGEIKKSVFSIMNRILPAENVLPMHCSANIGKDKDTALFFGLSGTGKTTLSSSADRNLIGDDEHGWGSDGIFNFEGGCYAKTINLKQELEPLIWDASQRFGSVLENVGFDPLTRQLDFDDGTKTENTRAAYPIRYIKGFVENGRGDHPRNIFFLSADAFGVLPPISLLSREQAVYYFLLGYTAKLAGTEKGLGKEPEATFSTCFGEPFLPLFPTVYADLLMEKIRKFQPNVWLINTGWSGGPFGVGSRIKLPYSRSMIKAALKMDVKNQPFHIDPTFGLKIPDHIEGVPDQILDPVNTWNDKANYSKIANTLIAKIHQRMDLFAKTLSPEIIKSGPNANQ
jgi:phosphoenolpyruvate carboxykinase (ATP)